MPFTDIGDIDYGIHITREGLNVFQSIFLIEI